MVLPADAVEVHKVVHCELHASTLGEYLGHRKLEVLVWNTFYCPKLSANV